jgi:hypothetical protein
MAAHERDLSATFRLMEGYVLVDSLTMCVGPSDPIERSAA